MYIVIAGKNKCAIDVINYLKLIKKYKNNILVLPNRSDNGIDGWQKSFRKHAKNNKIKIVDLNSLIFTIPFVFKADSMIALFIWADGISILNVRGNALPVPFNLIGGNNWLIT